MYLIGEPIFGVKWRSEFYAPIGQAFSCLKVLEESTTMDVVAQRMKQEYLAIVWAMHSMGLDFRLACRDIGKIDQRFVSTLHQAIGCKLAGFPGHSGTTVQYPRDFCTVFHDEKLLLVNPEGIDILRNSRNGWKIEKSIYGEGGRILPAKKTALVGDYLRSDAEHPPRKVSQSELEILHSAGISTATLPLLVSVNFGFGGVSDRISINDHLDRIGSLIWDQDGNLHLIIDPDLWTVDRLDEIRWLAREPEESIALIREVCRIMNIALHIPTALAVPYSINLQQFGDGRVLMTSGEPELQEIVSGIVGRDNVVATEVPIRFFPVWSYAGIRCLVSDAPEIIMTNAS